MPGDNLFISLVNPCQEFPTLKSSRFAIPENIGTGNVESFMKK